MTATVHDLTRSLREDFAMAYRLEVEMSDRSAMAHIALWGLLIFRGLLQGLETRRPRTYSEQNWLRLLDHVHALISEPPVPPPQATFKDIQRAAAQYCREVTAAIDDAVRTIRRQQGFVQIFDEMQPQASALMPWWRPMVDDRFAS